MARTLALSRILMPLGMLALVWFGVTGVAEAKIFHTKASALELAFPQADRVEARDLFLSEAEAKNVEEAARVRLESRMVTVYVGYDEFRIVGYAFLDTHNVRTLPETFLLVLDAAGRVKATHILAFHEPIEYLPTTRWLDQFQAHELDDDLWLNRDISGLAGSTLSTRAVTAGVRRLLAVFEEKIAHEHDGSTPQ